MSPKRRVGKDVRHESQRVLVGEILSAVGPALQNVQNRTTGFGLQLQSVVITLQTVRVRWLGGKVKFFVFVGGSRETEQGHEMVLSLTPPSVSPPGAKAVATPTLAKALEDAIVEAAESVKDAKIPDPLLLPTTLLVGLAFAVTNEEHIGIEVPGPISFEGKLSRKQKAIHKIEVVFVRPPKV